MGQIVRHSKDGFGEESPNIWMWSKIYLLIPFPPLMGGDCENNHDQSAPLSQGRDKMFADFTPSPTVNYMIYNFEISALNDKKLIV